MNFKKIVAATILLVPVVTSAAMIKPAAATESRDGNRDRDRVVVVESRDGHREERREFRHERRRVFVPGHWEMDRHGHRFWVPDRYEYRYF